MQNNQDMQTKKPTAAEDVQLEPLKDVVETGDKNENVPIISDDLHSEEVTSKLVENVNFFIFNTFFDFEDIFLKLGLFTKEFNRKCARESKQREPLKPIIRACDYTQPRVLFGHRVRDDF